MTDAKINCYSVRVEIPNGDAAISTLYFVLRGSEDTAIDAVQKVVPAGWTVAEANRTTVQQETVDALQLRPGEPRHI